MQSSSYLGISRETNLRTSIEILNNNVANASSDGYKRSEPIFKVFNDGKTSHDNAEFSSMAKVFVDRSVGALNYTGNLLDFGITKEDGYFSVMTESGDILYTRSGHFRLNSANQIVTEGGAVLLSDGYAPLEFPQIGETLDSYGDVFIDSSGFLKVGNTIMGKIGLFSLRDPSEAKRVGDSMYYVSAEDISVIENSFDYIKQKFLESSNVSPVKEMTDLLEKKHETEEIANLLSVVEKLRHAVVDTLRD